jgi:hypothetical protein
MADAIEESASAVHDQWIRWARTLLEKEPGISGARRDRWAKLFIPYADLSEESKEQDRKEVRLIVAPYKARLLSAERERDEAVLNAHSYASQILEAQVAANEAEAELATLRAALQALRADPSATERVR